MKKVVPIVESNSRKKIPIMNAGRLTYSMNTLIRTDQVNSGIFIQPTPFARMVNVVVTKLTPDSVDDAPNNAIPAMKAIVPGFGPPACPVRLEYGGYITQVMSAASPLHIPVKIRGAAATIIQNPSALILGNARSLAPICSGKM